MVAFSVVYTAHVFKNGSCWCCIGYLAIKLTHLFDQLTSGPITTQGSSCAGIVSTLKKDVEMSPKRCSQKKVGVLETKFLEL